jgi:hypothetical protein
LVGGNVGGVSSAPRVAVIKQQRLAGDWLATLGPTIAERTIQNKTQAL